ncbi:hypothetical protein TPENAI_60891 [Tenacibaculum litopenaei]|uniref:hypothetical protein n=1 Tax=Tenacibaculum litopenaei TaxID=396016 RepID=UPI0038939941
MKLKANNFTGILPNGNRYRITSQLSTHSFTGEKKLKLLLQEFILDGWFSQSDYTVVEYYYEDKTDYKTALRSALIEMEEKLGVQLLKADLAKVA